MIESLGKELEVFTLLDWIIIAGYFLISLGLGICFTGRAGRSLSEYFVSGRNLPWWIIGTSMVATTFAADTPLVITGWIRTDGIWKNWFWWNFLFIHVFIVFVFARLWRRAEVITDNELIEIRYGGRPAAFLRAFKALYFSTIFNFLVMGWVTSAMAKILKVFFGFETAFAVLVCIVIAFGYTILSGLWGVVLTDFLQYFIALLGTVLLACVVLSSSDVGGYSGFINRLGSIQEHLSFFVTRWSGSSGEGFFSSDLFAFLVYVLVIWWSSHNADGGGYFIQRISSAKNERHAILGMAWFSLNHYVIRCWPWIIVALFSLMVYPSADRTNGDQEAMYVVVIKDYLGAGLKGLLFVSFLAAFMSTLTTQLNWGASYLVNDIYRRFIKNNADEKHYVVVSRFFTLVLAIFAGYLAFHIKNIGKAWIFLWAMSAGLGSVLILRWFWWRINAWSEIVALGSSVLFALCLVIYSVSRGVGIELKHQVIVIPLSMACWLTATFLTPPESEKTLVNFYKKVRPWGWWNPVREKLPELKAAPFLPVILNWFFGVGFLAFSMMGIGKLLLGFFVVGLGMVFLSLCFGALILLNIKREGFW